MNRCLTCKTDTQNKKYCSKSCAAKSNNIGRNRYNTTTPVCKQCKSPVARNVNVFCSNVCQNIFATKQRIVKGTATHNVLRTHLIRLFGSKCSECGWCSINPVTQKVPIELDHIDGDSTNNVESNVRLLCPNCHSLKPTYKALNKGKGRKNR